jgi:hypothetical protein
MPLPEPRHRTRRGRLHPAPGPSTGDDVQTALAAAARQISKRWSPQSVPQPIPQTARVRGRRDGAAILAAPGREDPDRPEVTRPPYVADREPSPVMVPRSTGSARNPTDKSRVRVARGRTSSTAPPEAARPGSRALRPLSGPMPRCVLPSAGPVGGRNVPHPLRTETRPYRYLYTSI